MTLLKTAVQLGGAAALLNVGAKAFDRHEKTRMEHNTQQQQASAGSSPGPSYRHQPYCNGTCGGRCDGAGSGYQGRSMSPQPPQQRYLNPQGQSQNPFGSQRAIGPVESGDGEATPPAYEYESMHSVEESGKARDTKA